MFKNTPLLIKYTAAMLLCSSFAFAQTVINNSNVTFSGLYTPSAPVLDGDPTDACWTNAILGGESNPNRISNGVFPNAISRVNNTNDNGTSSGVPPTANSIPSGASASFSTTWDLDYFYFIVKSN